MAVPSSLKEQFVCLLSHCLPDMSIGFKTGPSRDKAAVRVLLRAYQYSEIGHELVDSPALEVLDREPGCLGRCLNWPRLASGCKVRRRRPPAKQGGVDIIYLDAIPCVGSQSLIPISDRSAKYVPSRSSSSSWRHGLTLACCCGTIAAQNLLSATRRRV